MDRQSFRASRRNYRINLLFYRIMDHFMCFCIVNPCVVLAFRGLWMLEDSYFFENNSWESMLVSFALGYGVIFFLTVVQDFIIPIATDIERKPVFFLANPTYKLIWCVAFISQWRAVWILYGLVLDEFLLWGLVMFFASVLILSLSGTFPTAYCSTPMYMTRETVIENAFQCITCYETKFSNSRVHFLSDCFYSVFIIQTVVVIFWRAAWSLLDLCCYKRLVYTMPIGTALTMIAYVFQDVLNGFNNSLNPVPRRMFQNFCAVYTTFCCVLSWHDLWNICDLILSDDPVASLCTFFAAVYILEAYFDLEFLYCKSVLTFETLYPKEYLVIDINVLSHIYMESVKMPNSFEDHIS